MLSFFYSLNEFLSKDSIFYFCAFAGSGMFIIQFLFSLFGGDHHDQASDPSGETDSLAFKWLSKQAITGFVMMVGWVRLTCRKEFGLNGIVSAAFALAGGFLSILFIGLIFNGARKLRSSGTVFRIEEAIGKEGMTYHRIPKGGMGKVIVSLHNHTHEIEAISLQEEELPSFTTVHIVKKVDEKTVLVALTK
ncbi:MAG: hypothetical protein HYZ54_10475 [Ignavibacteriae bacterium]|nr:hypothetical protein [Ignavibacteriota bacterium]